MIVHLWRSNNWRSSQHIVIKMCPLQEKTSTKTKTKPNQNKQTNKQTKPTTTTTKT